MSLLFGSFARSEFYLWKTCRVCVVWWCLVLCVDVCFRISFCAVSWMLHCWILDLLECCICRVSCVLWCLWLFWFVEWHTFENGSNTSGSSVFWNNIQQHTWRCLIFHTMYATSMGGVTMACQNRKELGVVFGQLHSPIAFAPTINNSKQNTNTSSVFWVSIFWSFGFLYS